MKYRLLFILIAATTWLNAQPNVDSLKYLSTQFPDSTELYLQIARPYLFRNIDSAYLYLNKGLNTANKNESTYELGRVYDNFGIYYGIQSKYDSALFYYDKSIQNFKEINSEFALANVLNNLGLTLSKKGDYENSAINYLEAVDLYHKLDRLDKAARTYNNLGIIFEEINDPEKALSSFEKSIEIAIKIEDNQTRFMATNGKAEILNQQKKHKESLTLFKSVYQYFKEENQTYYMAMAANNVGTCYIDLGEYKQANNYLLESLEIKRQFNDLELMNSGYAALAELYQKQKTYARALIYVDSAILVANELDDLYYITDDTRLKSIILHESGNYQKSSELFNVYIVLQDSLNDVLQTETITELNNKYEVTKKDKELAELSLANEQQQQEIEISRIKYLSVAVAILLIAVSIIFYLIQLRQRDKLRQALLNEEMDGLRLRITRIMSDVKLEEIVIEKKEETNSILNPLTEREVEILKQAVTNKSNAEIGNILFISPNTVKYHLKNIYTKIGVSSKLEARAFFT